MDHPHKITKVAITTLGCKVNQYESASFHSGFVQRGVEVVPFSQQADIYIINTCAVTSKAGAQSRQTIRKALKTNPEARLVVTGCYSQVAAMDILDILDSGEENESPEGGQCPPGEAGQEEVGRTHPLCIVGNGYKHLLVDFALATDYCDLEMYMTDISTVRDICHLPVFSFSGRTRAYVKVQDGCNSFCSYCIVPLARGRSRSEAPELVLGQIRMFAEAGYKEIVVTGIHVGMYGLDLPRPASLATLLAQAAALHPGVRFRLSSLEPVELSQEMLQVFQQHPNLLPHLHIPLQSGDSGVLERMNRRYDARQFRQVIEQAHVALPRAAIGVDIMVGFPGEDEAAFQASYELLASLPITYLHVFPYSKRPGTKAARFPGQISGKVKAERVKKLQTLSLEKKQAFYAGFIGQTLPVLAETRNADGLMRGFSDNYIPILFSAPASLRNNVVPVKIDRVDGDQVFGSLVA